MPGSSKLLTARAEGVAVVIASKHWAMTLEKTFNWSMLYLVLFFCSRFTPVFLSWLGEELKLMEFQSVCLIFYVVGLIMFLLPPVPGVPVYIAAGLIIVQRGKQESWLNFYTANALSSVIGLVLKLNAVAMQQKLIGEGMGKFMYIQQLVGVHTISIRAIAKILSKPGLTKEKVAILCGGPDWPTSVLTGILGQSLPQMLLGTLPCFFLIVPCVLGGSCLNEENFKALAPMMIMMVGITQGGVMLSALVFILKETERSYPELSQPLDDHEELHRHAEAATKADEHYKESTKWCRLSCFQKVLLTLSVGLELMMCWVCFFLGGVCFRKFEIGNDLDASYMNGGLRGAHERHGKVTNMVRDPGKLVFLAVALGLVLHVPYRSISRRAARRCEPEPPS
jgi:hypothetical protein